MANAGLLVALPWNAASPRLRFVAVALGDFGTCGYCFSVCCHCVPRGLQCWQENVARLTGVLERVQQSSATKLEAAKAGLLHSTCARVLKFGSVSMSRQRPCNCSINCKPRLR
eukprot:916281-Amphidinium_carterae.1